LACGDVAGVPADAAEERGGEAVEEEQPHHVQAGLGGHDAALVWRDAVRVEAGEVDPAEVRPAV
jgi:hypothetical protein